MDRRDGAHILIVDDVEVNRMILHNIILNMNQQPELAESGVQALEMVKKRKPQLILLDISMPEMDGYELCKILKDNADTRDIPIIFISAYDEPENIVKGFNLGGADYITKPFIREVVQARVGIHLKLSQTVDQLTESNRRLQISVNEQLAQMEKEKRRVLYAMGGLASKNANYDRAHMERLQYNCKIFSQALQLSPKYESLISDAFVDAISIAAPLSDLGNMAIPSEILKKQGAFTPEEREIMKSHTTIGAEMLTDIMDEDYNDYVQMSIDIANYHHENWDGSGYPEGLSGEEIPLAAQIVSVMGEFCALTEDRGYRKAFTKEEALQIMEQDADVKFNGALYDICKKISRQLH
ncbi:MAG: response regulator [Blautia sp.]|nr:response regulator [Blautia sp.]